MSGLSILFIRCDEGTIEPITPVNNGTANALKILPLGDSRVEGFTPEFDSYRYELWKLMESAGWDFDYIGSRQDGGNYPQFNNKSFDTDHEGTGGAQTFDNLAVIQSTINTTNAPDVVLLGIGGNDLADGNRTVTATIADLNQIIDYLQSQNPNVIIFLEQIAPGRTDFMNEQPNFWDTFYAYNAEVANVATQQTSGSSQVIAVDMAENWSDAYMADDVHYNAAGAKVVAERYFAAMDVIF